MSKAADLSLKNNYFQCDQMIWPKFRQLFGKNSQKSRQNEQFLEEHSNFRQKSRHGL